MFDVVRARRLQHVGRGLSSGIRCGPGAAKERRIQRAESETRVEATLADLDEANTCWLRWSCRDLVFLDHLEDPITDLGEKYRLVPRVRNGSSEGRRRRVSSNVSRVEQPKLVLGLGGRIARCDDSALLEVHSLATPVPLEKRASDNALGRVFDVVAGDGDVRPTVDSRVTASSATSAARTVATGRGAVETLRGTRGKRGGRRLKSWLRARRVARGYFEVGRAGQAAHARFG